MLYNKHNLAVARFAAKDGIREEIGGVLFTKEKTAATDGVRLLEVSTDSALNVAEYPQVQGYSAMRGCSPFIVNAKMLAEVKIPKTPPHLPVLQSVAVKHIDAQKVEVMTTDLEAVNTKWLKRADGKFPDYEQIFPKENEAAHFIIDGAKLAELLKVMAELPRNGAVEVIYYGTDKPIELRSKSETQTGRGLIMPIRE